MDYMLAYMILGMRRSGNHMIIQSIIRNFSKVCYYNNITKITDQMKAENNDKNLFEQAIAERLCENPKDPSIQAFIFSMEDATLCTYDRFCTSLKSMYGITKVINVVVVRDILNLAASRRVSRHSFNQAQRMTWKSHVNVSAPNILVLYNKYITSEDYRQEIAKKLEVKEMTLGDKVAMYGGGSSYAPKSNVVQPTNNYLERYLGIGRIKNFQPIPDDLITLSEQVFGLEYTKKQSDTDLMGKVRKC